jgi:hypothetical protein
VSPHRLDVASLAVLAATVVAGLLALPFLPSSPVVHFDAAGRPDGTLAAPLAVAVVPAFTAVVLGSLRRGSLLGRGRDRAGPHAALLVVAGAASVHAVVLAWNLGVRFDPRLAVVPGVLAVLAGTLYARLGTGPGRTRT